jgi:hypothetical protein
VRKKHFAHKSVLCYNSGRDARSVFYVETLTDWACMSDVRFQFCCPEKNKFAVACLIFVPINWNVPCLINGQKTTVTPLILRSS